MIYKPGHISHVGGFFDVVGWSLERCIIIKFVKRCCKANEKLFRADIMIDINEL